MWRGGRDDGWLLPDKDRIGRVPWRYVGSCLEVMCEVKVEILKSLLCQEVVDG